MRNIYIVRHGKVLFPEGEKRCIGHTEIPLSEEGLRQAENLKTYMKDLPITHIFSSPLQRCEDTAEIISRGIIPVTVVNGLSELYMGEWENIPLKQIHKSLESEPESGEKRKEGLKRFREAMNYILRNSEGDIVCVAHAGINCCFLSDILGTNLAFSRAIPQPYGSFSRIRLSEDGRMQVMELGRMPERAPGEEKCEELWKRYHTPLPVIRHCRAVAETALKLTEKLKAAGCEVDDKLVYGSALMHDAAKAEKDHCRKGAEWMLKEGYPEAAVIICKHHDLSANISGIIPGINEQAIERILQQRKKPEQDVPDETDIIYLADKYVQNEQVVSLEQRFAKSEVKCERCIDKETALIAHDKRFEEAKTVEKRIWKYIIQGGSVKNGKTLQTARREHFQPSECSNNAFG